MGGCSRCLRVLEQSGLKSALEVVHWREDLLESEDPRLSLLLMACESAKRHAYMDGVSKVLSLRLADLLLWSLCPQHAKTLMVAIPSSMAETGAMEGKNLLHRPAEGTATKVELRGRPDLVIMASQSGMPLRVKNVPLLNIVVGDNKSTRTASQDAEGLNQLLFYVLLSQMKNLGIFSPRLTTGIFMTPKP